jgi:MYXO-CTERM domain-containing protein
LLLLVLAEPAFGAKCQSIPGRSALDQYCETLPSASGPGTPTSSRGNRSTLPRRARSRLADLGDAGAGILALSEGAGSAGGTSSGGKSSGQRARRGDATGGEDGAPDEPSSNPLSALTSAVDSGSSSGPAFLWILLLVAAVLAGLGWLRYRQRTRGQ